MRVIAAVSDNSGCGFWRLEVPANALMAHDDAIKVEALRKEHLVMVDDKLVGVDPDLLEADVFVLQRPMIPLQLELLRVLQLAGVAVVVEIDDDLHGMHKDNTAAKRLKPHHLAMLRACCVEADIITCTTEALASRYARHGRFAVLPNYPPEAWLGIEAVKEHRVGWSGTVATHPKDLQTTQGAVGRALADSDWQFRVIGRSELVRQHLGLAKEPELSPWLPISEYPYELAKLDIGIAPLTNSPFNRAKSWLKPIEMAACGVPVVMADVGEYRRLAEYGIGVLASSGSDWRWALEQLMADADLRASLARQQRRKLRKHELTIEANAHRWVDAWRQAIRNRQASA